VDLTNPPAPGSLADHPEAPALAAELIDAARRQERKQNVVGGTFMLLGIAHLIASKATGELGWANLLFGGCAAVLGALIILPTPAGSALRALSTALTPFTQFVPGRRAAGAVDDDAPAPVVVKPSPGQGVVVQQAGPASDAAPVTVATVATAPPPDEPPSASAAALAGTTPDA
jgi:hypothetical protein